jgi:uncharacterized protein (DUF302 family)
VSRLVRWTTAALGTACLVLSAQAAERIGIFETILESSQPFAETAAGVEAALNESGFELHATHDLRVPEGRHRARLFVLTSPAYRMAAAGESPRTVSAQVLRIAVYTLGDEQKTFVNMANPVAHAMVYYAGSEDYDALVEAAMTAAAGIRSVVHSLPGTPASGQLEPMRTEKKYRSFNGDGPAKMMAKFRNWEESQLTIREGKADDFAAIVDQVADSLAAGEAGTADEPVGWEIVAQIPFGDDAVYFGLTNPYIEDRMVRINSRFRSEGKTEDAPYPGVDHVTALPTDVLVVRDGNVTRVLHYGQMWRMQLYFWDSGYRAFTANMGVPGEIADSIEAAVLGAR